jgi:KUP system potassium uptake protein
MPFVNWGLFVTIVLAVVMFKSSSNLAAAYGIAVCTDMLITTVLTFFVIRYGWKYPLWLCIAATGFFFVVDLAFWASNLMKLFDGGWFPLLIGGIVFMLMLTWKEGRKLLSDKLRADCASTCPAFWSRLRHRPHGWRAQPCSSPPKWAPCPTPCCTT